MGSMRGEGAGLEGKRRRVRPHTQPSPPKRTQTLADRLPDWMGYGFLYLVSSIPVIIAGSVIAILFFNSLR